MSGRTYVARAELVLARPDTEPLSDLGLKPDPLQAFAGQFDQVRADLGEEAAVVIDVLPATPRQQRRLRKRLLRQAHRRGQSNGGGKSDLAELLNPGQGNGGGRDLADTVEHRYDLRQLWSKLGEDHPLFAIQILIRAESEIPGRAEARVKGLEACFRQFGGQNHFRALGLRIPGVAHLGADMPWRRAWFDRRFESGLFRPGRRSLVNAREIGGLLKPPTKHCAASNVARIGGVVPPAPRALPTFKGQADLLPIGKVSNQDGDRMVGVPLKETFFSYVAGRSRYGKTEMALNQFLHLVRSGHGGMFIDPHEDAVTRLKGYLTEEGMAERVVELNLAARGDSPQPGWNLLSMQGHGPDRGEMAKRVRAVTTAFSSALGWGERNTRALNLTTQATQSLVELAFVLPTQLQPTIFQLTSILGDDEWRTAILPHLSRTSRDFWEQRFPRLGADAITPITNPLDTLYSSPAIKAMLGSSRSTYDIRSAMDEGKIVLACLGSGDGETDNLMANFLVSDLIRAARERVDTPPELRKPFYLFLDELQIYDGPVAEQIAAILEQTAKYGLRLFGLNQDPSRLSKRTFQGLVTNRSHLFTTVVSAESSARLAREWGGTPPAEVITKDLQKYEFLAHVTLGAQRPAPFRLKGVPVEELFGEPVPPEGQRALVEAIDRNTQRRRPSEVGDELEELPARILEHLGAGYGRDDAPAARIAPTNGDRPAQPTSAEPDDESGLPGVITLRRKGRRRGRSTPDQPDQVQAPEPDQVDAEISDAPDAEIPDMEPVDQQPRPFSNGDGAPPTLDGPGPDDVEEPPTRRRATPRRRARSSGPASLLDELAADEESDHNGGGER